MQLHFANNFLWKYFYELLLTVNKFFVCRDHITLWAVAVGRRGRTWNSNFSNNGLNFRYASNLFIWLSTFCQQLSKYSDLKRHSFVSNIDYQIISFCPMSMSIFLFLCTQYWGNHDCCVVSVVWRLPPSLSLPGVVVSLMVRVQHKKQTITSCYNS